MHERDVHLCTKRPRVRKSDTRLTYLVYMKVMYMKPKAK